MAVPIHLHLDIATERRVIQIVRDSIPLPLGLMSTLYLPAFATLTRDMEGDDHGQGTRKPACPDAILMSS
jgi:hypothetical protein